MIAAIGPLSILMVLLFTAVDFGTLPTFFYYVVMGILFWTAYKVYVIPYYALGAELTNDFNERTNLRGVAGIGMYIAMWFVSAGPMAILDRMLAAGHTEQSSRVLFRAILGAIGLVGGIICWWTSKGKELVDKEDFERGEKDISSPTTPSSLGLKPLEGSC